MANILVIHQEHHTSTRIYKFLREEGHKVACSENREETLSIIDELSFDLVLLDAGLDESNGSTTFQDLQARNSTLEGILICKKPDINTAIDSIRGGLRDYITVPVEKDLLIRAVTRVLRNKKMQDLNRRLTDENLLYQNHLEQMVAEKTESLNNIIRQTIKTQDREKATLAHVIFDNITQPLSSFSEQWDTLCGKLSSQPAGNEAGRGALHTATDASRAMISWLNPLQLQPLGMETAIRTAGKIICPNRELRVSLSFMANSLEGGWDLNIYRILEDLIDASGRNGGAIEIDDSGSGEGFLRISISGEGIPKISSRPDSDLATANERMRLLHGTVLEEKNRMTISIPLQGRKVPA